MASSGSKVTITEELRRYGKNISICTQRLQGLILGQSQETRSPVEDGEDDCEENEVFVEEGDVWLLVPDESREMAEVSLSHCQPCYLSLADVCYRRTT